MAVRPTPDHAQIEARLLIVARMLESATAELNQVVSEIKQSGAVAHGREALPSPCDERSDDGK